MEGLRVRLINKRRPNSPRPLPCIDIESLCTVRVSNVLVEIWLALGIAAITSTIS